jgi:hypothetical protein
MLSSPRWKSFLIQAVGDFVCLASALGATLLEGDRYTSDANHAKAKIEH